MESRLDLTTPPKDQLLQPSLGEGGRGGTGQGGVPGGAQVLLVRGGVVQAASTHNRFFLQIPGCPQLCDLVKLLNPEETGRLTRSLLLFVVFDRRAGDSPFASYPP